MYSGKGVLVAPVEGMGARMARMYGVKSELRISRRE